MNINGEGLPFQGKKDKKAAEKQVQMQMAVMRGDTLYAPSGGFTDWGMTGVGSGESGNKPGKYLHEGHPDLPTQRDGKPISQQAFGPIQVDPRTGRHFSVYNDPNKWAIEDVLLKKKIKKSKK